MSSNDVEEKVVDIKLDDLPVEDFVAEAFEILFSVDDRKTSNEMLQSVDNFSSISHKFHSLIEVCGLQMKRIRPQ